MRAKVLTQVSRKQQVVILVLIPSVFALRTVGIFLNPVRSKEEYSGVGGRVPISRGGNLTVIMGVLQSLRAA